MEIDTLLSQLESADLARREEAADLLAQQINAFGAPLLTQALTHRKSRVRREAARLLGRLRDPGSEAIERLADLLLERADKLKRVAAQSLSQMGAQVAPAVLARIADATTFSLVPMLDVLGHTKATHAQDTIQELFWSRNGRLETAAAKALGRIDFRATLHAFSSETRAWEAPIHRQQKARNGLVALGLIIEDPIDLIDASIDGGDSLTAHEISQGKGNPFVVRGAVQQLAQRTDREAIDCLIDACNYPHDTVAQEAQGALRTMKGSNVLTSLQFALQHPKQSTSTRILAAQVMYQSFFQESRETLIQELISNDNPTELRLAIIQLFRRTPTKEHLAIWGECLAECNSETDEAEYASLETAICEAIQSCIALDMPEDDRMFWLRDLLSHQPNQALWNGVCALLTGWPASPERELAIIYANQHRQDWAEHHELLLAPFQDNT